MRALIVLLLPVVLADLTGCTALLPRGRSEQASRFATFEAARQALDDVQPYRTTAEAMKTLGFDIDSSANVRQIPYPQLVGVLVENPYLPIAELDDGIRDCIAMRQGCRAYQFHFSRLVRQRRGNFLLDFMNFRRVTRTSGWRFEGIVLLNADGLVLFRNHAGEPNIDTTDESRNPLGPFQSLESVFR